MERPSIPRGQSLAARRTISFRKNRVLNNSNHSGSRRLVQRARSSDNLERNLARSCSDDSLDTVDEDVRRGGRRHRLRNASIRSSVSSNASWNESQESLDIPPPSIIHTTKQRKASHMPIKLVLGVLFVGCLLFMNVFMLDKRLGDVRRTLDIAVPTNSTSPPKEKADTTETLSRAGYSPEVQEETTSLNFPDTEVEEGMETEKDTKPWDGASKLEAYLHQHGPEAIRKSITAYTEPTFQDTVPGTGSRNNPDDKNYGVIPDFKVPLPRRTQTPDDLIKHIYPKVQTCHDLPSKFPIDKGLQFDADGNPIAWNVGNDGTPPDFPQTEAKYCPVELDPFLPWIHDVFTSSDGSRVEIVAQNMRRCRTGSRHTDNVNRLVPQVTLVQAVSVQRLNETQARTLAPDLWKANSSEDNSVRYRLAPHKESDPDGQETRFICRFHKQQMDGGNKLQTVVVGETLSEFPFNYELITYRKNIRSLLSPRGNDGGFFWASNLHFYCPIPKELRGMVARGHSALSDGTPTVHVDLVPIRTSARYDEVYLTEDQIGPTTKTKLFNPAERWGPDNVLPRVEASGRWTNIPVCPPPEPTPADPVAPMDTIEQGQPALQMASDTEEIIPKTPKPHFLAACLWASTEFKGRGDRNETNTDTFHRLQEWIEFHRLVGFDHIYVYDNSGAHSNETSLLPVTQQYPEFVTRIDWPSVVCSNNKPGANSPGERSSQYAAEASCRARYGPHTEWMASFDTDEYMVPMGKYTSFKEVLQETQANILSFRSSRGKLRKDHAEPHDGNDNSVHRRPSSLFLEAYNCDSAETPKPQWADRARKQIYRSDYVKHHFVHYSTVTNGILETYQDAKSKNKKWYKRYREGTEFRTDEVNQAIMVHTKTVSPGMTLDYKERCRFDYSKKWQGCWVGNPWPTQTNMTGNRTYDESGMDYNCWINQKVEEYWIPRLKERLSSFAVR